MIDRTKPSVRVVKTWTGLPTKPPCQYSKLIIRPNFREGPPHQSNLLDPVPVDFERFPIHKLAEGNSIFALGSSAQWLAGCLDLARSAWGANIVSVVIRKRTSYTSSYPIDENVEFIIIGSFGSGELYIPNRANVIKTKSQIFVLMDELSPGRKGLLCFDETTRKGWDSW